MLYGPVCVKEDVLRSFFEGTTDAGQLAADLVGTITREGEVLHQLIEDMAGEFTVEPRHLVRVCDGFLDGHLDAEAVEAIGFCLVSSDSFEWEGDSPEGGRVAEVAHDWSAPEINFAVTEENVTQWRNYLQGAGGRPQ